MEQNSCFPIVIDPGKTIANQAKRTLALLKCDYQQRLVYQPNAYSIPDWHPGDLVEIDLTGEHPRQYSIAGSSETGIDLLVRSTGELGTRLVEAGTAIGSRVAGLWINYIGGVFKVQPDQVWISSGSGAAPFRGALQQGMRPHIWIHERDLSVDPYELYFPTEHMSRDVEHTFVSRKQGIEAVSKYLNNGGRSTVDTKTFYVVGGSNFVSEATARLVDLGVPPLAIRTDTYGAAED